MTVATHEDVFNLSLYARADDYERVIEAITENGGELTEELALQLAAVEDQFEVKAERVALFIRNLEAMADATDSEVQRLTKLADNRHATARSLKQYLFEQMQRLGKERIERPLAKLSIVNNGGQPAVKWAGNLEDLPSPYRTTTVETRHTINRQAVIQASEENFPLPEGLTVERGRSLRIR